MASRHFYCQTFSLLIFFHKKRKGIEGRLWSDKKRENQGTNNQSCKHTWWEILATSNAYDVQHYKNVRMYYKEHVYIHRGNVLSSTTCTQQSEIFATLQRWKLLEKIGPKLNPFLAIIACLFYSYRYIFMCIKWILVLCRVYWWRKKQIEDKCNMIFAVIFSRQI